MVCGVHGILGVLVVQRADMECEREGGSAITQNQLTTARIVWALDIKNGDAMLTTLVQVRLVLEKLAGLLLISTFFFASSFSHNLLMGTYQ